MTHQRTDAPTGHEPATGQDDDGTDEPYALLSMMPDAPDVRVLASVVLVGGVDDGCVVHLCMAYGGHYWACTSCEAQGMDDTRGSDAAAVLDPDAVRRAYEKLTAALASSDPVAALPTDPYTPARGRKGVALAGLVVPGGRLPRVDDPTGEFERIAAEWHESLGDRSDADYDDE